MKKAADQTPDGLILAAIERASLHRARGSEVPAWAVFEHLGISRRSGAARQVRERLSALVEAGKVNTTHAHSVAGWELTTAGRRYLGRQRRTLPVLPESPQHAAWRNAHTLAEREIGRFRMELRAMLTGTVALIELEDMASDDLYEAADDLAFQCRRLASATYCLREWEEPSDDRPDIEPVRDPLNHNAGRRNPTNWGVA